MEAFSADRLSVFIVLTVIGQAAGGIAEFPQRIAECPAELRQLRRAEEHQRQHQNNDQAGNPDIVQHGGHLLP
jgi:hypothetical protein